MLQNPFRYTAIISYSRADVHYAKNIQATLEESWRGLDKKYKATTKKILIARDESDFNAGEELSQHIEGIIRVSEHLIVICSYAATNSLWVNQEIGLFRNISSQDKRHKRKIIPVIIEGENPVHMTVFPHTLVLNNVPLGVDLRSNPANPGRDPFPIFKKILKNEGKDRILAAVLDVEYTIFAQRQEKAKKRRKILQIATMATVIAFIVLSAWITEYIVQKPGLERISTKRNPHYRNESLMTKPDNYSSAMAVLENETFRGNDYGEVLISASDKADTLKLFTGGMITNLYVLKNGTLIASNLDTGIVMLYDLKKKAILKQLVASDKKESIYALNVSEKQGLIVYGDSRGRLFIYQISRGSCLTVEPPMDGTGRVACIYIGNNGMIFIGYHNGKIYRYDINSRKLKEFRHPFHFVMLYGLYASENGIVIAGFLRIPIQRNAVVLTSLDGSQADTLDFSESTYQDIFHLNNDRLILVTDWDANIAMYDLDKKTRVLLERIPTQIGESKMLGSALSENRQNLIIQTETKILTYQVKGTGSGNGVYRLLIRD